MLDCRPHPLSSRKQRILPIFRLESGEKVRYFSDALVQGCSFAMELCFLFLSFFPGTIEIADDLVRNVHFGL